MTATGDWGGIRPIAYFVLIFEFPSVLLSKTLVEVRTHTLRTLPTCKTLPNTHGSILTLQMGNKRRGKLKKTASFMLLSGWIKHSRLFCEMTCTKPLRHGQPTCLSLNGYGKDPPHPIIFWFLTSLTIPLLHLRLCILPCRIAGPMTETANVTIAWNSTPTKVPPTCLPLAWSSLT